MRGKARARLGALGEKVAAQYLQGLGFQILATNLRTRQGELDIIAQQGGVVSFVEVRTRGSREFGAPEESLTAAKKERLIALAEAYLQEHPELPAQWSIDLLVIEVTPSRQVHRLELIRNAVGR